MGWWAEMNRRLSRNRWYATVMRPIAPRLDRLLHRLTEGRITLAGTVLPTLMLTTTGRRTGQTRVSPLAYVDDGDAWAVVGTNWGGESHPGWTYNLLEDPEAVVEVDGERHAVRAERIDPQEMDGYWPRFDELYPGYEGYRERVSRQIRMFRLIPRD